MVSGVPRGLGAFQACSKVVSRDRRDVLENFKGFLRRFMVFQAILANFRRVQSHSRGALGS